MNPPSCVFGLQTPRLGCCELKTCLCVVNGSPTDISAVKKNVPAICQHVLVYWLLTLLASGDFYTTAAARESEKSAARCHETRETCTNNGARHTKGIRERRRCRKTARCTDKVDLIFLYKQTDGVNVAVVTPGALGIALHHCSRVQIPATTPLPVVLPVSAKYASAINGTPTHIISPRNIGLFAAGARAVIIK